MAVKGITAKRPDIVDLGLAVANGPRRGYTADGNAWATNAPLRSANAVAKGITAKRPDVVAGSDALVAEAPGTYTGDGNTWADDPEKLSSVFAYKGALGGMAGANVPPEISQALATAGLDATCESAICGHVKRIEKTVFYGGARVYSMCQRHGAASALFATVRRSAATGALVATPVSEDVRLGNVSLRRVGTDAEVDDFFEEVEEAKKRRNWPETVCELRDLGCAAPGCRNQVHITVPSFATGSSTYFKVHRFCKAMINPSNKGQARAHPEFVERWHPPVGPMQPWPVWKVRFDHDARTWTNLEPCGTWCDENGVASPFKGRPESDGADA